MKSIIRKAKFVVVIILSTTLKVSAQSGPEVCKIHYDYDVAGNRIKREYRCERTWTIGDALPWENSTLLTSLSPNPTSGTLTGVFSEPPPFSSVRVSTIGGITVLDVNYTQPMSSFTIDISAQIPGTYLVTVYAFNQEETFTIIKM